MNRAAGRAPHRLGLDRRDGGAARARARGAVPWPSVRDGSAPALRDRRGPPDRLRSSTWKAGGDGLHARRAGAARDDAQLCRRSRLHYCDLLGHPIDSISRVAGVAARMEPGARAPLDETYFKRIEAIEFAVKYDDGVGEGSTRPTSCSSASRGPRRRRSRSTSATSGTRCERPDREGDRAAAGAVRDRPREGRRPHDRPRAARRDPRRAGAQHGRAEPPLLGSRADLRGARARRGSTAASAAPCSTSRSSRSRRPRCGSSASSTSAAADRSAQA